MKIKPVKGRPMLHWVGKRPIDTISNYPAQLVDTYNVENPEKEPSYDKFMDGPNLLFHGDNKEILSTLLVQGFRGKIDLIYIDPPFASGADYVRKVTLRGGGGQPWKVKDSLSVNRSNTLIFGQMILIFNLCMND